MGYNEGVRHTRCPGAEAARSTLSVTGCADGGRTRARQSGSTSRFGDTVVDATATHFNASRRPTMPVTTLPVVEGGRPPDEAKGADREGAIRAGVLAALGRPDQRFRVVVVPLW